MVTFSPAQIAYPDLSGPSHRHLTREQAQQLVDYDYHVVDANGRAGVMLTDGWMPAEEHIGPFVLTVVFHYAEKHPRAPESIQAVVDGLQFRVRGQAR